MHETFLDTHSVALVLVVGTFVAGALLEWLVPFRERFATEGGQPAGVAVRTLVLALDRGAPHPARGRALPRIRVEEALEGALAQPYRAYEAETARLVPGVWSVAVTQGRARAPAEVWPRQTGARPFPRSSVGLLAPHLAADERVVPRTAEAVIESASAVEVIVSGIAEEAIVGIAAEETVAAVASSQDVPAASAAQTLQIKSKEQAT